MEPIAIGSIKVAQVAPLMESVHGSVAAPKGSFLTVGSKRSRKVTPSPVVGGSSTSAQLVSCAGNATATLKHATPTLRYADAQKTCAEREADRSTGYR